jgi:hypothetical protein
MTIIEGKQITSLNLPAVTHILHGLKEHHQVTDKPHQVQDDDDQEQRIYLT